LTIDSRHQYTYEVAAGGMAARQATRNSVPIPYNERLAERRDRSGIDVADEPDIRRTDDVWSMRSE